MKANKILSLLFSLTLVLSACVPEAPPKGQPPIPAYPDHPDGLSGSNTPTLVPPDADGRVEAISNSEIRLLPGQINIKVADSIEIPLPDTPAWVAGIPHGTESIWAVSLEDGTLMAFSVGAGGYAQVLILPEKIPPMMPLTIFSREDQLFALTPPGTDASVLTAPVFTDPEFAQIAYIAGNGDLVVWENGQEIRLAVNALPDSQILTDHAGKLLLLSNPTERYTHGVLGDSLEATGITIVELHTEPNILRTISIPEPDVIEGIYPTWTDMDRDGAREILVTLSNAQTGARIVAFREDGSLLAEGPAIGTGFRWRHQLVSAPFGETGEHLLAVIRTPHLGGIVEFYRLDGNKLEIVAEIPGFSTHAIGSRTLNTAQAGDFNTDGQVELLLPDQSHTQFGIVGLEGISATRIEIGAELVTNLASVITTDADRAILAAGLSNNILKIWLP